MSGSHASHKGRRSPENYKTELCKHYPHCPFGDKCNFAHGTHDLRKQSLDAMARNRRIPSAERFRNLPCKTFVMCGACPYHDRCVFLHDPRLRSLTAKEPRRASGNGRLTEQKSEEFWWPDMEPSALLSKTDVKGLPHVEQEYVIPEQFKDSADRGQRAMYSLWGHFATFCNMSKHFEDSVIPIAPTSTTNTFINKPRLGVFVDLAEGQSVQPQQPPQPPQPSQPPRPAAPAPIVALAAAPAAVPATTPSPMPAAHQKRSVAVSRVPGELGVKTPDKFFTPIREAPAPPQFYPTASFVTPTKTGTSPVGVDDLVDAAIDMYTPAAREAWMTMRPPPGFETPESADDDEEIGDDFPLSLASLMPWALQP